MSYSPQYTFIFYKNTAGNSLFQELINVGLKIIQQKIIIGDANVVALHVTSELIFERRTKTAKINKW